MSKENEELKSLNIEHRQKSVHLTNVIKQSSLERNENLESSMKNNTKIINDLTKNIKSLEIASDEYRDQIEKLTQMKVQSELNEKRLTEQYDIKCAENEFLSHEIELLQGKISDYFRIYGSPTRNVSVDTYATPNFVPMRNRGKTMQQNHFTLDTEDNNLGALEEEHEYVHSDNDDDHTFVYNEDYEKMRSARFARYANSVLSMKRESQFVDAGQLKKANDKRIEYEIMLQALNKDNDALKELLKNKEREIKRYKKELMVHEGMLDNEKKINCKVYGFQPFGWMK